MGKFMNIETGANGLGGSSPRAGLMAIDPQSTGISQLMLNKSPNQWNVEENLVCDSASPLLMAASGGSDRDKTVPAKNKSILKRWNEESNGIQKSVGDQDSMPNSVKRDPSLVVDGTPCGVHVLPSVPKPKFVFVQRRAKSDLTEERKKVQSLVSNHLQEQDQKVGLDDNQQFEYHIPNENGLKLNGFATSLPELSEEQLRHNGQRFRIVYVQQLDDCEMVSVVPQMANSKDDVYEEEAFKYEEIAFENLSIQNSAIKSPMTCSEEITKQAPDFLAADSSFKELMTQSEMQSKESVIESETQSSESSVGQNTATADDEIDQPLIIADDAAQIIKADDEICGSLESEEDLQMNEFLTPQDVTANEMVVIESIDKGEETLDRSPKNPSRNDSQKKMEEGKTWLLEHLQVTVLTCVIKLNDIEESYLSYCTDNKKEPLTTPVLARLIHRCFPNATKCRLGSRGQQRIHYRGLQFLQVPFLQPDKNSQAKRQVKDISQTENGVQQNSLMNDNVNLQTDGKRDNGFLNVKGKECQSVLSKCENLAEQTTKKETLEATGKQVKISEQQQRQYDEDQCKAAAEKLRDLLKYLTGQGDVKKAVVLRDFAHSASCQNIKCSRMCSMFRRVRRHVVSARHNCHVLRLYSLLLRHHISSCTDENCGLPACPALRATKSTKRQQHEHHSLQPSKRAALPPRSPCGSLPDSAVNSPPCSPEPLIADSAPNFSPSRPVETY